MGRLQDRIAIITGAASGIGKATAELFAKEGASLQLVDLNPIPLLALADSLGNDVAKASIADISDAKQTRHYVDVCLENWGGIDILVANAGVFGSLKPLIEVEEEEFDRVIAVNQRGVWLALRAALPEMKARGGGSVVITSSVLGLQGIRGGAAYVASKHAVTGLMKVAALEYAIDNIRATAVPPGMVRTSMADRMERELFADDPSLAAHKLIRTTPMRRYADPNEIAELILFLASASFTADGGQRA